MKGYIKLLKEVNKKQEALTTKYNNEVKTIQKDSLKSEAYKKELINNLMLKYEQDTKVLRLDYTNYLTKLESQMKGNKTLNLSDPAITNALKVIELLGANITHTTVKDLLKAIESNEGRLLVGKAISNITTNTEVLKAIESNSVDYANLYESIQAEGFKAFYTAKGNNFNGILDYTEKKLNGEEVEEAPAQTITII